MDQFVTVRMIQMNGVDLSLFNFDYDLTFAVFFMNADKTIYGRYGSRSDQKEATKDISMEGFRKSIAAALDIHRKYPLTKEQVAGKTGKPVKYQYPEKYPLHQDKYTASLDFKNNLARSCIHCHQVREADRRVFRDAKLPIPDKSLYPWPMPDVIGLSMDASELATVKSIAKGSPVEKAGFKADDQILQMNGQAIISIADVQWILENSGPSAEIKTTVRRAGKTIELTTKLPQYWRQQTPFTWRTTTWGMRRMVGGLKLEPLSAAERQQMRIPANRMAIKAAHVGQYGDHAVAKRAGMKKNDVLIAFDGKTNFRTEGDVLAYVAKKRMPGYVAPVTVLRNGKTMNFRLRLQ